MKTKRYQLSISGMQCADCENAIEQAVSLLPGVFSARASYADESLTLYLDSEAISPKTVCAAIKARGYDCKTFKRKASSGFFTRFVLLLAAILGMIAIMMLSRFIQFDYALTDLNPEAGFGVIFLIGLMTGFHCVGMCGGFVLSYTTAVPASGEHPYRNPVLYGIGKIISYASFGALFGFLGGAISFSTSMRSWVMGVSGLFLIVYGLSLLQTFTGLRHFHIRLPRSLSQYLNSLRRRVANPLAIGLLNGFMIACGPLQAMYILAAGIGDPVYGAAMLAIFALGTLPLMSVFGVLSTWMTSYSSRYLLTVSGVIIVVMGCIMLNRGLLLSGKGYDAQSMVDSIIGRAKTWLVDQTDHESSRSIYQQEGYQIIYTEVEKFRYVPSHYTLRKGVPVKWIINVKELSPCNQQIIVSSLSLTIDLHDGLQLVEFIPGQKGVINWSCSMGMIPGVFKVVD